LNRPDLMIDTCCLGNKTLMAWLGKYNGGKFISAVSYMEYKMDEIPRGKGEMFDRIIRSSGIKVRPFDKNDADIAAKLMAGRPAGGRRCEVCGSINWNDTMIAAQAERLSLTIVTENVKDYPSDSGFRVMTANDVMKSFHTFRSPKSWMTWHFFIENVLIYW